MLERDTVAAYDYQARDTDELSLRRGEPVAIVAEVEPGWVHVRLPDGREGLVPHNHLVDPPQPDEAVSDVETLRSEVETDFESLGQSRALPDWGYDHGVRFEGLRPEHPLWLQSALEGFVHALLFNTTAWGLADDNVRTVMRHHHRGQQEKRECDSSGGGGDSGGDSGGGGGSGGSSAAGSAPSEEAASSDESSDVLEAYARRHRAALDAAGSAPLRAQRYLVVEAGSWGLTLPLTLHLHPRPHPHPNPDQAGSWGLGNRLSALVSGLALAMATNRTLLVRDWFAFPSRLGELLTAPAGLGGWEGLSYERVTTRLEAAGVGAAQPR